MPMKHRTAAAVWLCATVQALAQDGAAQRSRHSFGVQVPFWFGAGLSMSGTPNLRSGTITGNPDVDARQDRFYADGFNRVNSVGNPAIATTSPQDLFPRTTFFGFESNSQVTPPTFGPTGNTPGHLSLHDVALVGGDYAASQDNDQASPGVELFYRYRWKDRQKWTLDLEAGLSWMNLQWSQGGVIGATAGIYEDRYSTGTVDPRVFPDAGGSLPYAGPYEPSGGTPWIGSTPERQPYTTAPASVQTDRKFTLDSLVIRLGPGVAWKPTDRWELGLLAGLAVGYSNAEYRFRDTIRVENPTIPTLTQSGQGEFSDVWLGLYSAARVTRELSEHWQVLVEVRHIWTEDRTYYQSGRVFNLDLSQGFGASIGAIYRF